MTDVVAHRGSSHAIPEHTLAAYQQAIDEGADALECDVRLTRDGVLICMHDRRVDRTSTHRGVVSTLELADLDTMDFGAHMRRDPLLTGEWETYDAARTRVLTFEALLDLVRGADRRVELHVETKHPVRYGPLVEQELVAVLDRFGLRAPTDRRASLVTLMSFSPVALRRMHARAPRVPTVLLLDRLPSWARGGYLPRGVDIAGPSLAVVRSAPDYVERVHARGRRAHVWTVDAPADVDYVVELGADAVITNRPALVLSRLGR